MAKLVENELLGDPRRLGQHEPVHVHRRHERTRHDNPDASGHLNVDPERLGDHENVREEDGRVEPSRACRFGVPVDGLHGDGRNIRRMPEQLEEAPAHLLFVRGVLGEVPTRLTCVCGGGTWSVSVLGDMGCVRLESSDEKHRRLRYEIAKSGSMANVRKRERVCDLPV